VHVPSGREIALKSVKLFEDPSKHAEIIKELRALQQADSPYVVGFYGAFYAEGTVEIALEYMDLGSLADVLKRAQTFPEPAIANVAWQVIMID
jgi:serine/threonine protein kinase